VRCQLKTPYRYRRKQSSSLITIFDRSVLFPADRAIRKLPRSELSRRMTGNKHNAAAVESDAKRQLRPNCCPTFNLDTRPHKNAYQSSARRRRQWQMIQEVPAQLH
jgi:hypothetical protein